MESYAAAVNSWWVTLDTRLLAVPLQGSFTKAGKEASAGSQMSSFSSRASFVQPGPKKELLRGAVLSNCHSFNVSNMGDQGLTLHGVTCMRKRACRIADGGAGNSSRDEAPAEKKVDAGQGVEPVGRRTSRSMTARSNSMGKSATEENARGEGKGKNSNVGVEEPARRGRGKSTRDEFEHRAVSEARTRFAASNQPPQAEGNWFAGEENKSSVNAAGNSAGDEHHAENDVGGNRCEEPVGRRVSRSMMTESSSKGKAAAEEKTGAGEDRGNGSDAGVEEEVARTKRGKRKCVEFDEGELRSIRDTKAVRVNNQPIAEDNMCAEKNGNNVAARGETYFLFDESPIPTSEDSDSDDDDGESTRMAGARAAGLFDVNGGGAENGMVDEMSIYDAIGRGVVIRSESEGERSRENRRLRRRERRAALHRAEQLENPRDANRAASRRQALEIARSRAAHFAHFNLEGANAVPAPAPSEQGEHLGRVRELLLEVRAQAQAQAEQPNSNRGGDREDWPGPWTVARRLVEGRFAAASARQDAVASQGTNLPSLVNWKPSRTPQFSKSKVPPSLQRMCLDLLCRNIDVVESLDGVPDDDKKLIIQGLCALRKITPVTTKICISASSTKVVIPDCTYLTEEDLIDILSACSPENLQALELTMCGRGITDHCLATLCAKGGNSFPELQSLVLKGAYRLVDQGVTRMLNTSPRLKSVDLTQCSLISEHSVEAIADTLGATIESLVLDNCSQLSGLKLLPALRKIPHLRKLSLAGIPQVTDGVISELLVPLRFDLQELGLRYCQMLTDVGMQAVSLCQELKVLDLGHISSLTDVAIGLVTDNCRSLKTLRLCRGKFSDAALAAFVSASGSCLTELSLNSARLVGDHTMMALAQFCKSSLEILDVSWCRLVSDQALGLVADSCIRLHSLRLFGCTQVTNSFLEGHSNEILKVTGIWEGPCVAAGSN
ncbi:hypothetical protein R1flu_016124 [Riccia fluitans]|uniref:F-box/LRR-repeat protein 15-like leucin rich repeat domain-containing protein n=1 Tax=Riccia fluitans TaxID=41844 RepID=A0ABD1YL50_9MARC